VERLKDGRYTNEKYYHDQIKEGEMRRAWV
jgi:hypothetical protein